MPQFFQFLDCCWCSSPGIPWTAFSFLPSAPSGASTCSFHTVALEIHTLNFEIKGKKNQNVLWNYSLGKTCDTAFSFTHFSCAHLQCSRSQLSDIQASPHCIVLQVWALCLPVVASGLGPGWGWLGCSHCPTVCDELCQSLIGWDGHSLGLFPVPGGKWGFACSTGAGGSMELSSDLCRLISMGWTGKLLWFYVSEAARFWMMNSFDRKSRGWSALRCHNCFLNKCLLKCLVLIFF